MANTSMEYKAIIKGNDRKFYGGAEITLSDSTVLTLDNTKIKGLKIEDATSQSGQFTIGSAIINKLTLVIDNLDEAYSNYDFTDAIIRPTVGLQLSTSIETLNKGVFTADDPKAIGSTISLTARDNMSKLDKPFKDVTIVFPTTATLLLNAVCLHCGVTIVTSSFLNNYFTITARPLDDAVNCREVISWIAQLGGNFARMNTAGALELKWYDFTIFEGGGLDGGTFDSATPYATGDIADGGNFTDYSSGDSFDGGSFTDTIRYHHFYSLSQLSIATDDVVITGISVTDSAETPNTVLYGTSGYVISLEGNKLVQSLADATLIANSVGAKIVGMKFRSLSITTQSNPSVEAGDVAYVSDRKGNSYQTLVTNVSYGIGQPMRITCDAESPARNSSVRFSADTKTIIEARKLVVVERTARELAVQQLANTLANSSGLYMTKVQQPDLSYIYYLHDKLTLAESMVVWKLTANAFGVSTDGGVTYPYGLDANGTAILNRIYAIGIDATYITTGKLLSIDGATLIDMAYGVANSDNLSFTDNVQSGYPLRMPFNIDSSVSLITKVLLKYTVDKFRTYSDGASSGGSYSSTSASGGGNSLTSASGGGESLTSGSGGGTTTSSSASQANVSVLSSGGGTTSSSGGTTHVHGTPDHIHSLLIVNHTHGVTILSHAHGVTIPSHMHAVSIPSHEHSFSISSHTHSLNFGIMETPITDYAIDIYVDGTLRQSIINDIANIQGIIDLTAWITTVGWHTIELRSTTLKRISAQINIKSYIRS